MTKQIVLLEDSSEFDIEKKINRALESCEYPNAHVVAAYAIPSNSEFRHVAIIEYDRQ